MPDSDTAVKPEAAANLASATRAILRNFTCRLCVGELASCSRAELGLHDRRPVHHQMLSGRSNTLPATLQGAFQNIECIAHRREQQCCESTTQTVVLSEVEKFALYLQSRDLSAFRQRTIGLSTLAANMNNGCLRKEYHLPTPPPLSPDSDQPLRCTGSSGDQTSRPVRSLHDERDSSNRSPSRIRESTHGPIPCHRPYGYPRRLFFQTRSQEKHVPRSGKVSAARLKHAIAAYQPNSEHATFRIGVHLSYGLRQRIGRHKGIGIQQQDIAAARKS